MSTTEKSSRAHPPLFHKFSADDTYDSDKFITDVNLGKAHPEDAEKFLRYFCDTIARGQMPGNAVFRFIAGAFDRHLSHNMSLPKCFGIERRVEVNAAADSSSASASVPRSRCSRSATRLSRTPTVSGVRARVSRSKPSLSSASPVMRRNAPRLAVAAAWQGHAQRLAHRLLGRTHRPLPVDRAVHPIEFGRGYCLRIIIEPGGR